MYRLGSRRQLSISEVQENTDVENELQAPLTAVAKEKIWAFGPGQPTIIVVPSKCQRAVVVSLDTNTAFAHSEV